MIHAKCGRTSKLPGVHLYICYRRELHKPHYGKPACLGILEILHSRVGGG